MKTYFKISLKIALLTGAIFLLSPITWAQKDILELLPGTYKLSYDDRTGAQRLTGGGVNFIYQGNTMYCDSAWFYEKRSELRAYGQVHVNSRDTLNLFCDSLAYNGKTKKAKLWGNVRVRDREYKLVTDTLEYDSRKSQMIYRNGGRIESILRKEILTSRVGYFYPNSKNLFFSGNVKYNSDSLAMTTDTMRYQYIAKKVFFYGPTVINSRKAVIRCEKGWYHTETEEAVLQKNASVLKESRFISGDSLYVNPQKGISVGKGHVFYRDTSSALSFTGDHAFLSDEKRYGYLTGNALAEYRMKKDTLYLHADTLYSYQDSLNELKQMRGYDDVRFFSRDFQGKCDSLSYDREQDKMEMFYKPVVWSRNAELKGNFMVVYLQDTVINRVEITEKSTAVMEIDSGKYYNQVAGKNMFAYFVNNELKKLDVKNNAQTVYFPEDKKESDTLVEIKRSGMARLYASDLKVDLDSGEVTGITYLGMPDGVLYPMDQINAEEQFVQGFSWNPVLRPKSKEDLLTERKIEVPKPEEQEK